MLVVFSSICITLGTWSSNEPMISIHFEIQFRRWFDSSNLYTPKCSLLHSHWCMSSCLNGWMRMSSSCRTANTIFAVSYFTLINKKTFEKKKELTRFKCHFSCSFLKKKSFSLNKVLIETFFGETLFHWSQLVFKKTSRTFKLVKKKHTSTELCCHW